MEKIKHILAIMLVFSLVNSLSPMMRVEAENTQNTITYRLEGESTPFIAVDSGGNTVETSNAYGTWAWNLNFTSNLKGDYSGALAYFRSGGVGGYIEYSIPDSESIVAGYYNLYWNFRPNSTSHCTVGVSVNDKQLGDFSQKAGDVVAGTANVDNTMKRIKVGTVILKADGTDTVRFTMTATELDQAHSAITVDYLDFEYVPITSELINVEGFQIRTKDTEECGVSFRAVCKAPNVGTTIATIDGVDFKIKDIGTIYTIESDKDNALSVSDTYLNPNMKSGSYDGSSYQYFEGLNYNYTIGYIATTEGISSGWKETDTDNTYYVRTMTKCDINIATKHLVRAFVVAQSDSGDEIIVYGKYAREMTIAEVADYLYVNSLSSNFQGHKFLYNSILSKEKDGRENVNAYYRTTTVDYGWNDNLFTPEQPTVIYPVQFGKTEE